MRLINSKDSHFSGHVVVYGEEVYVNTSTGSGFTKIFELMKCFINKLAFKYSNILGGIDDAKQEVCLSIFEGILKYDPDREASLSTFLNTFVPNRMVDKVRKAGLRGRTQLLVVVDDASFGFEEDPICRMELERRTEHWDDKWKTIMVRLFVSGEKISDVAADEGMTPWGLTRAVRRKLSEARKM